MHDSTDLRQGTLDMLILKAVSLNPLHGYGVLLRIKQISKDALEIPQGSLYPALYRMERRGWLEAEWGESELGRRAKLYRLTSQGRAQLTAETTAWLQFVAGVSKILLAQ